LSLRPHKVAVLVSSCYKYRDAWPGLAHAFDTYWPACPYPRYVLTDGPDSAHCAGFQMIRCEGSWGHMMRHALAAIDATVVLYLLEDFWFSEPVDSGQIAKYAAIIDSGAAKYLRLYPCPDPKIVYAPEPSLGVVEPSEHYRTSLMAALWDARFFSGLIRESDDPWRFEGEGKQRTASFEDGFLSVRRLAGDKHAGLEYVNTAITRGKWTQEAHDYAKAAGLPLTAGPRNSETRWDGLVRRHRFFNRVNTVMLRLGAIRKRS